MAFSSAQSGAVSGQGTAHSLGSSLVWILWLGLAVAGCIGVAQRLMYGHISAGYGSFVPWGLWIGLYFLGVGISGGAFVIGAVGYMLGASGFGNPSQLRVAIVFSIAALLPAFVGVALDLGHMERLLTILVSPTFTSMMAFNAWMYNIFLVIAVAAWLLSFRDTSVWLKPLLVTGAFLSILFPSQSGVFFEAVRTNVFWHSPILSVLFLTSAFALGASGLLLVQSLRGPGRVDGANAGEERVRQLNSLRLIAAAATVIYLVFEFAELSIVFWSPGAHAPNVVFLLFGDYWSVFWILHVLLGSLVPLALLASSSRESWVLATLLLGLGFAAARMSVLIPGQIAGQIPNLQQAFQDVRLTYSYHPTIMEYLVGCFMVAFGMAIFYVGMRINDRVTASLGQRA